MTVGNRRGVGSVVQAVLRLHVGSTGTPAAVVPPSWPWKAAPMSSEARRAAVSALIALAGSADFRDRADAGRGLAGFAESAQARRALSDLVLDADDTFVTLETARALLRRQDRIGLAAVASALATADHGRADWIDVAVLDVFGMFARDRDAAVRECEVLTRDPDDRVRRGASRLIGMLTEINPVLQPEQDDLPRSP